MQLALDNAEAHTTPLGLPAGSLAFDVNPNLVTGANSQTHFEQIYARAVSALNNAVVSFDDAKSVTRLMRSEQDSLADYQAAVTRQEMAYTNQLIEIFGTPYTDDIGPGQTYDQGYTGPDLFHYPYVDNPQISFKGVDDPTRTVIYTIDFSRRYPNVSFEGIVRQVIKLAASFTPAGDLTWLDIKTSTRTVSFTLDADGFLQKPSTWTGKRASPGQIQNAINRVSAARQNVAAALDANATAEKSFDLLVQRLAARSVAQGMVQVTTKSESLKKMAIEYVKFWWETRKSIKEIEALTKDKMLKGTVDMVPTEMVAGVAAGVDPSKPAAGAAETASATVDLAKSMKELLEKMKKEIAELNFQFRSNLLTVGLIQPLNQSVENAPLIYDTTMALKKMDTTLFDINSRLLEQEHAVNEYMALVAKGQRILSERETFRQRTAAVIQGYRTRDAGYRIFRDEKLDRYKTLFDLAAKYAYLAANAYDYETGLLNTSKGKAFVNRIVNSRALGIVKSGQPQYAGSNTGDPGISSVLAEMKADWDVLRGRLGFNNPTANGTTVSLRTENLRIVNGSEGDATWRDALNQSRMANVLDDADVKRYCMQIDPGNGLPVPGIVIEFGTSIFDGNNLFGRELAGGDHYYDSSYFATKIFSVGVALEGYVGMDNPAANSGAVGSSGSTSPSDPNTAFLNTQALAATPGIYLIPVGQDVMRSPPLGDVSTLRSWAVSDVTIPLPFNVGGSDFSTKPIYTTSDSLTEPLFGLRKHATFRPVSTTAAFSNNIYGGGGSLQQSQFTNTRLIGRSVWNTRWKLVVPGYKLLHDPNDGLDRFINTVKDIKLYYVTYSYAGN
ncbi:MAG: hypothetical protein EBS84_11985 [Proteobacteria bacterium]|nr:hypothetical protein [Pseudomonadota bacterium]